MNFLLVLQTEGDEIAGASQRLCAIIGRKAKSMDIKVSAAVFGDCQEDSLRSLGLYGIQKVYQAPGGMKDFYSPEVRLKMLVDLIRETSATMVFLTEVPQSREIAPLLALELGAGLISECAEVGWHGAKAESVLNVYNGQYQVISELTAEYNVIVMADSNPGAVEFEHEAEAEIVKLLISDRQVVVSEKITEKPALQLLEEFRIPATELDISEADLIVGVGRGVKTQTDFEQIQKLTALLGASIGGSRPAVDEGYITFKQQIGQTGRVVTPELYLALGISGAVQHISGVQKGKILAINSDPRAPIFRMADLGVNGTLQEIIPLLSVKLRELRKEGTP